MAKKVKQHQQKSLNKIILKEIEGKLSESLKDYHKKVSDKKFSKKLRKAGKILSRSVTKENISVVPKKLAKPKKVKSTSNTESDLKSTGQ